MTIAYIDLTEEEETRKRERKEMASGINESPKATSVKSKKMSRLNGREGHCVPSYWEWSPSFP